jgi:hypothetical protein
MKYTTILKGNEQIKAKWFDIFDAGYDLGFNGYITNKKVYFCFDKKVIESYSLENGLKMYSDEYREAYNKVKNDFIINFLPMLGKDLRKALKDLRIL